MRQSFLIMLFAVTAHTAAAQAIYLFSDDDQYLGCYHLEKSNNERAQAYKREIGKLNDK